MTEYFLFELDNNEERFKSKKTWKQIEAEQRGKVRTR